MNSERQEVESYIKPENLIDRQVPPERTPSGRFLLRREWYQSKEGYTGFSRGIVTRADTGEVVTDIVRNYSQFHHSFVQKDGHEWLISGRSYMSQTIVNLDTGEEFEAPGDQYDDGAFCWAACELHGDVLLVDGCHWACPYEFRFFDFSDPRNGWPAIPVYEQQEYAKIAAGELDREDAQQTMLLADSKLPEFLDDGTIMVYETRSKQCEEEGCEIGDEESEREVEAKITLRRHGDCFVIENIWRSPERIEQDERQQAAEAERRARQKQWTEESELLAELKQLVKADPELKASDKALWFMYPSLNAKKAGEPNPCFFSFQVNGCRIEWGVLEGELQLHGATGPSSMKHDHKQTFERSSAGLRAVLDVVRKQKEQVDDPR